MHTFYIKHRADENGRWSVFVCLWFGIHMGHTIYAQHRAPAPRTKFMHTKYIYRDDFNLHIGIKENDAFNRCAIQKYGIRNLVQCVCVLSWMSVYALTPDFRFYQLSRTECSPIPIRVDTIRTGQFNAHETEIEFETRTGVRCSQRSRLTTVCHHPSNFENIHLACDDTLRSTLNFYCVKNHINKHFEQTKIKEWKL